VSSTPEATAATSYRPPARLRVVDTATGEVGIVHSAEPGGPTITLRRLGSEDTWEVPAVGGWRYTTTADLTQAWAVEPWH
jgi:hypothetical protein